MSIIRDELQRLEEERRALQHRLREDLPPAERADLLAIAADLDQQMSEYRFALNREAQGSPEAALRAELDLIRKRVETIELLLRGHTGLEAPGILAAVREQSHEIRELASRMRLLMFLVASVAGIFLMSLVWNVWLVSRILGG